MYFLDILLYWKKSCVLTAILNIIYSVTQLFNKKRIYYNNIMIKQSVYIDTSVIGGCFDNEFKEWSNKLILDFKNGVYLPVLSEVTAAEIEDAPQKVFEKYQEIREYNCLYLEIDDSVLELAEEYQLRKILSRQYSINIEMGYKPIDIYSPREVATIEND